MSNQFRILLLKIAASLAALMAGGCNMPTNITPVKPQPIIPPTPQQITLRITIDGEGKVTVGGGAEVKVGAGAVANTPDLPEVLAYCSPNCSACAVAKRELAATNNLPFRVVWKDTAPAWVNSYPTFHWRISGNEWRQRNGWDGLATFTDIWRRSLSAKTASGDGFAPTPSVEVERVIGLLPKPEIGFVDFGCGDGRWCIAAAQQWGCRATGVEIDPARAAAARERVAAASLSHLVTIITGDALTTDVQADVGVAYLWSDVLEQLRPRIEKLRAFASYQHQPPGLSVVQNGDSWLYFRPVVNQSRSAVWQGKVYSAPVCNSPGCAMCRSIRVQISGHASFR